MSRRLPEAPEVSVRASSNPDLSLYSLSRSQFVPNKSKSAVAIDLESSGWPATVVKLVR